MADTAEHIKILTNSEIEEIYGLPQFTHEDRECCFALSYAELASMEELRSAKSRACFILQLGYFRIRRTFIDFDLHQVRDDFEYVTARYNIAKTALYRDPGPVNKRTRLKHQQIIRELCGFRELTLNDRVVLEEQAKRVAQISSKPIYVFRILMEQLAEMRVVLPGYRYMQDTVSAALTHERHRLETLLGQHLTEQDIISLNRLLEEGDQFYAITYLRREPRDYSYGQIREEIDKSRQIASLYHRADKVLPCLDISRESIKYYASLIGYYSVYRWSHSYCRSTGTGLRHSGADKTLASRATYYDRHRGTG